MCDLHFLLERRLPNLVDVNQSKAVIAYEQRFLSCMAFSFYEVDRVVGLFTERKQTNYANNLVTLKAMQERLDLCSQGKQLQFFYNSDTMHVSR